LQLSVGPVKVSMKKKSTVQVAEVVNVLGREELQDVFMFTEQQCGQN
jgi:hypothetical protein